MMRSAKLITEREYLGTTNLKRIFLSLCGGVALPLLLALQSEAGPAKSMAFDPLAVVALTCLALVCTLSGEILERQLFFRAVVAPKMPGNQGDDDA